MTNRSRIAVSPGRLLRPVLATAALLLVLGQRPATAQITPAAPPGDPVVARVDGEPILLSEVVAAARDLPEQVRGTPPQVLFPMVLDQLIAQRAIVTAARRAGLDRDEAIRARIRRAEEQELQQAMLTREVGDRVSDDALRRAYDQEIARRPAEEEIRARHILVPTEAEARAALAEIRGGADFAAVVTRRSTGPGSREGGDLGFFRRGDMVPEFAEAAFALPAGQVSENPVRSPFGWHVIRVEERRRTQPPAFDEVRDQIREQMLQREVDAAVERIRAAARIERFNLDGSAQRATDLAEPPPPAAPPAGGRPPPQRR